MADVPDRGTIPNYGRIDSAMSLHLGTWNKIDELAAMSKCAAAGGRCQLMVEGCDTAPLQVTQAEAQGLLQAAINLLAVDALALGSQLTAFAQALPVDKP